VFRECYDVSIGYPWYQPEGVEVVTSNGGEEKIVAIQVNICCDSIKILFKLIAK
jgi:hypothetical protein